MFKSRYLWMFRYKFNYSCLAKTFRVSTILKVQSFWYEYFFFCILCFLLEVCGARRGLSTSVKDDGLKKGEVYSQYRHLKYHKMDLELCSFACLSVQFNVL